MSYTTWADYRLELYDGSRANPVILDDAINLRYRRRLYGGGDFSFSLHILSSHASAITQTALRYIRIWRRGTCVFDGVVYRAARKYKQSNRGLIEYIDVAGVRLGAAVASWRVGFSNTATGRFTYTGLVDDGFKALMEKTHGATAYTVAGGGARAITGFSCAANKSERAGSVTLDATGVNMYEFLDRWGRYYEVDWDITFDASMNFVFETYYPRRGTDRTEDNGVVQPVVMNDSGEETTEVDYFADAVGYCNAVLAETLDAEVKTAGEITTYQRRELVAGTSETEALNILLADKKLHVGYKQGFAETAGCRYITDWDVGDLVTQNNLHLGLVAADALIVEVVALINKQGQEELQVTFGDYPRGLEDRLRGTGAGGGGGYGDTPGGKTARLWGLRGDSNTWVKPDDTNIINVIGGTGMDVTEGTNTLTVTCALTGFAAHDIVGAYHTVTGAALAVVGCSSANTLGLLTPSSDVSGGGAKILACDANGDLTLHKLLFAAGEYIWSNAGNAVEVHADSDVYITAGATFVTVTSAAFLPGGNNSITNGNTTYRWSNVCTVLFNHSGTTIVIRGVTYTPPASAAAGVLACDSGGNLSWDNETSGYTPDHNAECVQDLDGTTAVWVYASSNSGGTGASWRQIYAKKGTHGHPLP